MLDLCADRSTFYVAGRPPMDLEATKQFAATFFNALPDSKAPTPERNSWETKRSMTGIGVMYVTNGQVAEFWVSPDRMTLMQQIGALPAGAP